MNKNRKIVRCCADGWRKQIKDIHVGGDIPGDDAVDLHVLLAPFIAESLRELTQSALSGRIRGHSEAAL